MEYLSIRRWHLLIVTLFLVSSTTVSSSAQTWTKELAPGVVLTQKMISVCDAGETAPQIINIIKADPKAPGVQIRAVLAQERVLGTDVTKGRETVSAIAKRLNAVAVVNADFFPMTGNIPGQPLNLHISNGELISEPNPNRVAFGMTSDGRFLFDKLQLDARITLPEGRWFPIRGINRTRQHHQMVAFTSRFFDTTCTTDVGSEAIIDCEVWPLKPGLPLSATVADVRCLAGDTEIPEGRLILSGSGTGANFIDRYLQPGTLATIEFGLTPAGDAGWEDVVEAVGGGPWLVRNGKVSVDGREQGFQPAFYLAAHPRTAVGATRDGKLMLVTVDGRQNMSAGMSLQQLAELMIKEGCVEAINLDGGGSTTMSTQFGLLSTPSGGMERAIANALAILFDIEPSESADFAIATVETVRSGEFEQLTLVDAEGDPIESDVANLAVWTTTGGAGFVDQGGRFHGTKARKGTVTARIGERTASLSVTTIPGCPVNMSARFEADPSGAPNRSILIVSLTDLNGNGTEGASVSVKAVGGLPNSESLVIDKDGRASTGVTWHAALGAPANVTVSTDDLPPVVVQRPK